jgi:hypothetical protein
MSEFYVYKKNIYMVMGRTKMKCRKTGDWVDAYRYTDGSGIDYVRECRDFEFKFVKKFLQSFLRDPK